MLTANNKNKIVHFVQGLPPRSHVGRDELNQIKLLNVKDSIQLTVYECTAEAPPLDPQKSFMPLYGFDHLTF